MKENKSWIKQHKILSGIIGFFILFISMGLLGSIVGDETNINNRQSSDASNLITANSKSFLPQENEIDRIWILGDYEELKVNNSGFIEGTGFKITKREDFSVVQITMEIYRFESIKDAGLYYDQETFEIDVRGVEELNLGNNCFGIDRDTGFSGYAEGYCLKNNIVVYIKSSSSSFMYVSSLKEFKRIILNKL